MWIMNRDGRKMQIFDKKKLREISFLLKVKWSLKLNRRKIRKFDIILTILGGIDRVSKILVLE